MNNVNTNNSKSNLPLLIIGAVLLAAIGGGWWFYSNSKTPPVKTNTNSANANSANKKSDDEALMKKIYADAPAGAQPPNMLGSPTATVTVEEFADYQCPTCATVHPKVQEIAKIYGNRIKFIYRSFPLTQIHQHAYAAAVAAEAASLQDKFWEMQTQLFLNQKEWSNSAEAPKLFEGYAQKIGLDTAKYQTDVLGMATKGRVDADMMRGRKIGVTGTPAIYINGTPLAFEKFDVESMRQIIDSELQKASSQPTAQASNQATSANQSSSAVNVANNGGAKNNVVNSNVNK